MQDHESHGLRNFLLFTITLGLVTFLWKERERLQEKLRDLEDKLEDALVSEPEGPEDIVELDQVDVDEPSEEIAEPALVGPSKDEVSTEISETIVETQESPSLGEAPLDDELETEEIFETESAVDGPIADKPAADNDAVAAVEDEPAPPTWVGPVNNECPEGFPIKARYATGHFHVPGDRGYDKIIPDCCYPSVEDAEADGFTPSRWT